jgi:threonine dehydratase
MVASYADGVCYEEYPIGPTLCDALVGGVGALSYEMLRDLLDDILVVKEETIRKATAFLLTEEKFVIEGGSATTLAAVWDYPEKFTGKKTALILTGGNIDGQTIQKVLE